MEYESTEAKKLVQLLESSEAQEKAYWLRRTRRAIMIWSLVFVLLALTITFVVLGLRESSKYINFDLHYVKFSHADGTADPNSEERHATIYETVNNIMPPDDVEGYNFTEKYYNSSNYEVEVSGDSNISNSLTYEESIYMQYELGYYELSISTDASSDDKFVTAGDGIGYNKRLFVVPNEPYTAETFLNNYIDYQNSGTIVYNNNNLYTLYTLENCNVESSSAGMKLIDIDGRSNAHIRGFHGIYNGVEVSYSFREVTIRSINGGETETTYLVTKRENGRIVACNYSNGLIPQFAVDDKTGLELFGTPSIEIERGKEIFRHTGKYIEDYPEMVNANEFYMPGRDMVFYVDWEPDDRYMVVVDATDNYTHEKIFSNVSDIADRFNLIYNLDEYVMKYQNDGENNDWDNLKETFNGVFDQDDWDRAVVLHGIETDANIQTFLDANVQKSDGSIPIKDETANTYYYPAIKYGYELIGWEVYTKGLDGKFYWKKIDNESKILSGSSTDINTEKHSETCVVVRPIWSPIEYNVQFDPNGGSIGGSAPGYSPSHVWSLTIENKKNTQGQLYSRSFVSNDQQSSNYVSKNGHEFIGWQIDGVMLFNDSVYDCDKSSCKEECVCGYITIGSYSDSEYHIVVDKPEFEYEGLNISFASANAVDTNRQLWVVQRLLGNDDMYYFYYFGTLDDIERGSVSSMTVPEGYYVNYPSGKSQMTAKAVWQTIEYTTELELGVDTEHELTITNDKGNDVNGYNFIYGFENYRPDDDIDWTNRNDINHTLNGVQYVVGRSFIYDMFTSFSLPTSNQIYRRGYDLIGYTIEGEYVDTTDILMVNISDYQSNNKVLSTNGRGTIIINNESSSTVKNMDKLELLVSGVNENTVAINGIYGDIKITPIWRNKTFTVSYKGVSETLVSASINTNGFYSTAGKQTSEKSHIIYKNSSAVINASETFSNTMIFDQYNNQDNNTAIIYVKLEDYFSQSTFVLDVELKEKTTQDTITSFDKEMLNGLFQITNAGVRYGSYSYEFKDGKYSGLSLGSMSIGYRDGYIRFEFDNLASNVSIKLSNLDYDLVENSFDNNIGANWELVTSYAELLDVVYDNSFRNAGNGVEYIAVQDVQNFGKYKFFDIYNVANIADLPNVGKLPGEVTQDEVAEINLSEYFNEVMVVDFAEGILQNNLTELSDNKLIRNGQISNYIYEAIYNNSIKTVMPTVATVDGNYAIGTNFYTIKKFDYKAKITAFANYSDLWRGWVDANVSDLIAGASSSATGTATEQALNYNSQKVTTCNSDAQLSNVYIMTNINLAETNIRFGLEKTDDKLSGHNELIYTVITKDYNGYNLLIDKVVDSRHAQTGNRSKIDIHSAIGSSINEIDATTKVNSNLIQAKSKVLVKVDFVGKFAQVNEKDRPEKIELIKSLFVGLDFNKNTELYLIDENSDRVEEVFLLIDTEMLIAENGVVDIYIDTSSIATITNNYNLIFKNRFETNLKYVPSGQYSVSGMTTIGEEETWISIENVTDSDYKQLNNPNNSTNLFSEGIDTRAINCLVDEYSYQFKIVLGENFYANDNIRVSIKDANGNVLTDDKYSVENKTDYYLLTLKEVKSSLTISFENVYRKFDNLTLDNLDNDGVDIYDNNVFVYYAIFEKMETYISTGTYNELEYFESQVLNNSKMFVTPHVIRILFADNSVMHYVTNGDVVLNTIQNKDAMVDNVSNMTLNGTSVASQQGNLEGTRNYDDLSTLQELDYVFNIKQNPTGDIVIKYDYSLKSIKCNGLTLPDYTADSYVVNDNIDSYDIYVLNYVEGNDIVDNKDDLIEKINTLNEVDTIGTLTFDSYIVIRFKKVTGYDQTLSWLFTSLNKDLNVQYNTEDYDDDKKYIDGDTEYFVIKLDANTTKVSDMDKNTHTFELEISNDLNKYSVITSDGVLWESDEYYIEYTLDGTKYNANNDSIYYDKDINVTFALKPGYIKTGNYLQILENNGEIYRIGLNDTGIVLPDGCTQDYIINTTDDQANFYKEKIYTFNFTLTITSDLEFNFVKADDARQDISASAVSVSNKINSSVGDNYRSENINPISGNVTKVEDSTLRYGDTVAFVLTTLNWYEKTKYTIKLNGITVIEVSSQTTYIDDIRDFTESNNTTKSQTLYANNLIMCDGFEIEEAYNAELHAKVITVTVYRVSQDIQLTVDQNSLETNNFYISSEGDEKGATIQLEGAEPSAIVNINETDQETSFSVLVDYSYSTEETSIQLSFVRFNGKTFVISGSNGNWTTTSVDGISYSTEVVGGVTYHKATIDFGDPHVSGNGNNTMTIYYTITTVTDNGNTYNKYTFVLDEVHAYVNLAIGRKLESYIFKLGGKPTTPDPNTIYMEDFISSVKVLSSNTLTGALDENNYGTNYATLIGTGHVDAGGRGVDHGGRVILIFTAKPGYYINWNNYKSTIGVSVFTKGDPTNFDYASLSAGAYIVHDMDMSVSVPYYTTNVYPTFALCFIGVTQNLPENKTLDMAGNLMITAVGLTSDLAHGEPSGAIEESTTTTYYWTGNNNSIEYTGYSKDFVIETKYNRSDILATIVITNSVHQLVAEITTATKISDLINNENLKNAGLTITDTTDASTDQRTITISMSKFNHVRIVWSNFVINHYKVSLDLEDKNTIDTTDPTNEGIVYYYKYDKEYGGEDAWLYVYVYYLGNYQSIDPADSTYDSQKIYQLTFQLVGSKLYNNERQQLSSSSNSTWAIMSNPFEFYYPYAHEFDVGYWSNTALIGNGIVQINGYDAVEGVKMTHINTDLELSSEITIKTYTVSIATNRTTALGVYQNSNTTNRFSSGTTNYGYNATDRVKITYSLLNDMVTNYTTTVDGKCVLDPNKIVTITGKSGVEYYFVKGSVEGDITTFELIVDNLDTDISIEFVDNQLKVSMYNYSLAYVDDSGKYIIDTPTSVVNTTNKQIVLTANIMTLNEYNGEYYKVAEVRVTLTNILYFTTDMLSDVLNGGAGIGGVIQIPYNTHVDIVISVFVDSAGQSFNSSTNQIVGIDNDSFANVFGLTNGYVVNLDNEMKRYIIVLTRMSVKSDVNSSEIGVISIDLNTYTIATDSSCVKLDNMSVEVVDDSKATKSISIVSGQNYITVDYGTDVNICYTVTSNMDFAKPDGTFNPTDMTLAKDLVMINEDGEIEFEYNSSDNTHKYILEDISGNVSISDNNKIATRYVFSIEENVSNLGIIDYSEAYLTIKSGHSESPAIYFYDEFTRDAESINNSSSAITCDIVYKPPQSSHTYKIMLKDLKTFMFTTPNELQTSMSISQIKTAEGYEDGFNFDNAGNNDSIKITDTKGTNSLSTSSSLHSAKYENNNLGFRLNLDNVNIGNTSATTVYKVYFDSLSANTYTMTLKLTEDLDHIDYVETEDKGSTVYYSPFNTIDGNTTTESDLEVAHGVKRQIELGYTAKYSKMSSFEIGGYTVIITGQNAFEIYNGEVIVANKLTATSGRYALSIGEDTIYLLEHDGVDAVFNLDATHKRIIFTIVLTMSINTVVEITSNDIDKNNVSLYDMNIKTSGTESQFADSYAISVDYSDTYNDLVLSRTTHEIHYVTGPITENVLGVRTNEGESQHSFIDVLVFKIKVKSGYSNFKQLNIYDTTNEDDEVIIDIGMSKELSEYSISVNWELDASNNRTGYLLMTIKSKKTFTKDASFVITAQTKNAYDVLVEEGDEDYASITSKSSDGQTTTSNNNKGTLKVVGTYVHGTNVTVTYEFKDEYSQFRNATLLITCGGVEGAINFAGSSTTEKTITVNGVEFTVKHNYLLDDGLNDGSNLEITFDIECEVSFYISSIETNKYSVIKKYISFNSVSGTYEIITCEEELYEHGTNAGSDIDYSETEPLDHLNWIVSIDEKTDYTVGSILTGKTSSYTADDNNKIIRNCYVYEVYTYLSFMYGMYKEKYVEGGSETEITTDNSSAKFSQDIVISVNYSAVNPYRYVSGIKVGNIEIWLEGASANELVEYDTTSKTVTIPTTQIDLYVSVANELIDTCLKGEYSVYYLWSYIPITYTFESLYKEDNSENIIISITELMSGGTSGHIYSTNTSTKLTFGQTLPTDDGVIVISNVDAIRYEVTEADGVTKTIYYAYLTKVGELYTLCIVNNINVSDINNLSPTTAITEKLLGSLQFKANKSKTSNGLYKLYGVSAYVPSTSQNPLEDQDFHNTLIYDRDTTNDSVLKSAWNVQKSSGIKSSDIKFKVVWSDAYTYTYKVTINGGDEYSYTTHLPGERFTNVNDYLDRSVTINGVEYSVFTCDDSRFTINDWREILTGTYVFVDTASGSGYSAENNSGKEIYYIGSTKKERSPGSADVMETVAFNLDDTDKSIANQEDTYISYQMSDLYSALDAVGAESVVFSLVDSYDNAAIGIVDASRGIATLDHPYLIGSTNMWKYILTANAGVLKDGDYCLFEQVEDFTISEDTIDQGVVNYALSYWGEDHTITRDGYNKPLFGTLEAGSYVDELTIDGDIVQIEKLSDTDTAWGSLAVVVQAGTNEQVEKTLSTQIFEIVIGQTGQTITDNSSSGIESLGGLIGRIEEVSGNDSNNDEMFILDVWNNYNITSNCVQNLAGLVGYSNVEQLDNGIILRSCGNDGNLTLNNSAKACNVAGLVIGKDFDEIDHGNNSGDITYNGNNAISIAGIVSATGRVDKIIYTNNKGMITLTSSTVSSSDAKVSGVAIVGSVGIKVEKCINGDPETLSEEIIHLTKRSNVKVAGILYATNDVQEIVYCMNKGSVSKSNSTILDGAGIAYVEGEVYAVGACANDGDNYSVGIVFAQEHVEMLGQCLNSGEVVAGTSANAAGIVYTEELYSIGNCINYGNVTGSSVAGVVFAGDVTYRVMDCLNTGTITGNALASGVVIADTVKSIINCYNSGAILGDVVSVGIAYVEVNLDSISDCYVSDAVIGNEGTTDHAYGIACMGGNSSDLTINKCYTGNYIFTGTSDTDINHFLTSVTVTWGDDSTTIPITTIPTIYGDNASMFYVNNKLRNSDDSYTATTHMVTLTESVNKSNIYATNYASGMIIHSTGDMASGRIQLDKCSNSAEGSISEGPKYASGVLLTLGKLADSSSSVGVTKTSNNATVIAKYGASGIVLMQYDQKGVNISEQCNNAGDIYAVIFDEDTGEPNPTGLYYYEYGGIKIFEPPSFASGIIAVINQDTSIVDKTDRTVKLNGITNTGNIFADISAGIATGVYAVDATNCINGTGWDGTSGTYAESTINETTGVMNSTGRVTYRLVGSGLFIVRASAYIYKGSQKVINTAEVTNCWPTYKENVWTCNMYCYGVKDQETVATGIVAILNADGNTENDTEHVAWIEYATNYGKTENANVNNWAYGSGIVHITNATGYETQAENKNVHISYCENLKGDDKYSRVIGGTSAGILTMSSCNREYIINECINNQNISAKVVGAGIVASMAEKGDKSTAKITISNKTTNNGSILLWAKDGTTNNTLATSTFGAGIACLIGSYELHLSGASGKLISNEGNITLDDRGAVGAGIAFAHKIPTLKYVYNTGNLYGDNPYGTTIYEHDVSYDKVQGALMCGGIVVEEVDDITNWNNMTLGTFSIGGEGNIVDIEDENLILDERNHPPVVGAGLVIAFKSSVTSSQIDAKFGSGLNVGYITICTGGVEASKSIVIEEKGMVVDITYTTYDSTTISE